MGKTHQIIAGKEELFQLIPQRPPMVMIDALLKAEEKEYQTQFTVRKDNLFVEEETLLEAGLIENIAQTSAAGFGQQYFSQNKPIPLGFIGAVQKLTVNELPKVGDHLVTTVILAHKVMNISVVQGTVYNGTKIAARCDMKLFLQEEQGQENGSN